MKRLWCWVLGGVAGVVLGAGGVGAGATAPATVAASRAVVTTELAGEGLERELDVRYGIWFVGEKLPVWAKVTLPAKATAGEAMALVRGAAKQIVDRGLVIEEVPGSDGKVYVVRRAEEKAASYRYGNDVAAVPEEGVVTQIIPVRPGRAKDFQLDLGPLMRSGWTEDEERTLRHDCVIVTSTGAGVRRMLENIKRFEDPNRQRTVIEYVQVKKASAAEVSASLNARFAPTTRATTGTGVRERLYADFDKRTNTVVLNGPADQVKQAVAMIEQMEKEAGELAAEALERELDARYGIWFVGEKLPVWAKVTLAEKATAGEAMELVRGAVKRPRGGFRIEDVAGSEGKVFAVWADEARVVKYHYGMDVEKVPLTEEVVGQVMPLKKLAVGPLRNDLSPLTSGRIIDMDTRHNCLMTVDRSAYIHRFMEILDLMENQPGAKQPTELRQVTFRSAGEAASVINSRFAPPRQANGGRGGGGGGTRGGGGGVRQLERVYASSDARTNTVAVNGPEELVKQALAMIDEMEKVAETANKETPTKPALRARVTTPLAGEALADELDQRYGMWFVGEELWRLGQVTLPEKATAEEALALVRAAERETGGYEIVEVPGVPANRGKVFQVTRIWAGEEPMRYQYGADADKIALTDKWVGQVIPLKNEVARELAEELAPMGLGFLGSNTRQNCLIVRGSSADVRRLMEVVTQLDGRNRMMRNPIEYRQLVHLDAADVAKKVNARFAPPEPTTTGPRAHSARLYADFDPRTNTVIVNGPAELVKQAVAMIEQMEKEAGAATTTKGAETKGAVTGRE